MTTAPRLDNWSAVALPIPFSEPAPVIRAILLVKSIMTTPNHIKYEEADDHPIILSFHKFFSYRCYAFTIQLVMLVQIVRLTYERVFIIETVPFKITGDSGFHQYLCHRTAQSALDIVLFDCQNSSRFSGCIHSSFH